MTASGSRSPIELAIRRAMRGESDGADVPGLLVSTTLIVPSGAPVGDQFEGFVAVLYDRDGTPVLGVFTSLENARVVAEIAPYALSVTGRDLLRMIPPGHGIVVNPGHPEGFDLPPSGVAALRLSLS